MEDLSENAIRINCPHCNLASQAFRYPLEQTDEFYLVVDSHPIVEGHILIIPKSHVSCIGEYPQQLFEDFIKLNSKVSEFLLREYRTVSSFEHGIFGQTVFHSHIHYLPFKGKPTDIVSEGNQYLKKLNNLSDLRSLIRKEKGYLFFSINRNLWAVDKSLTAPRFFRDRFARALGRPERGNWKKMHNDQNLSKQAKLDALRTQTKWKYFSKNNY